NQTEFSEKISMSRGNLSTIINGKSCQPKTAAKIANGLGMDLLEIIKEDYRMATPRIKSAQDFKIEAVEAFKGQLDCYVLEEEKRVVQASLERVEAIQTMRPPDKPERLTYSVSEAAMVAGISIANRQEG
ncbi:helix-turn-helix domain-containing protein, partial [Eubacterium aggregans]|uniref:helix-turn-helix domain-containing protein n=1 Tax=Eubacterium aggregans TaxID=81409 RepID=UPI003F3D009E